MLERLAHLISVARNTLVKDDGAVQLMQISEGMTGSDTKESVTDDIPVIWAYGFSCNAPLKSEAIVARLGGDRSQSLVLASSHRPSRPKNLQAGDVMIYRGHGSDATARGAYIWLKDGVIQIDADGGDIMVQNAVNVTVKATTKVRVEAPKVECTGDFVGECDGTPISLKDLHDKYNAHHHTGITTGTGTSGLSDQLA